MWVLGVGDGNGIFLNVWEGLWGWKGERMSEWRSRFELDRSFASRLGTLCILSIYRNELEPRVDGLRWLFHLLSSRHLPASGVGQTPNPEQPPRWPGSKQTRRCFFIICLPSLGLERRYSHKVPLVFGDKSCHGLNSADAFFQRRLRLCRQPFVIRLHNSWFLCCFILFLTAISSLPFLFSPAF